MQPTVFDRILYTQILTGAGFRVRAISQIHTTRGGGVVVEGSFESGGKAVESVEIEERDPTIVINSQVNHVTVRSDGTFDLFIEHGDGD